MGRRQEVVRKRLIISLGVMSLITPLQTIFPFFFYSVFWRLFRHLAQSSQLSKAPKSFVTFCPDVF